MDHRIDVAAHQADLGAENTKLALLIGQLDAKSEQPFFADHLSLQNSAEHSVVDVPPAKDKSDAFSAEALRVTCSPFLDRPAGRHPVLAGQGGPCAADRFTSDIGGLLPIALCGRTSL
jgi:hypothetical protein